MVNQKEHVNKLFQSAMEGEKSLSRLETDGNYFAYCDEDGDEYGIEYERHYYYDDTVETIASRILMDKQVEAFLPKQQLASLLEELAEADALMVMEKLVFLWEDEEGGSPVRDELEAAYDDEYAQFVAEGFIGQIWKDRQIPVINVSAIFDECAAFFEPALDPPFAAYFLEGVLQTMFHEMRHLFYECNEIVSIGEGTPYPQSGGMEDEVEEYGNRKAAMLLGRFLEIVDKDVISRYKEEWEECNNAGKAENTD